MSRINNIQVQNDYIKTKTQQDSLVKKQTNTEFSKIFNNTLNFSKHATTRLSDRSIDLDVNQMARVADGVGRAGQKGIRDTLVLVDDIALVVNVPTKTVITAIGQHNNHVFSNIDGAVIV